MANIFADIKAPFVNDATLKRVMSAKVKDNIFQGIFTKPGEAVTEKYSEDTDAAEIQVIRVKPNANEARHIGADTNGAWFNVNPAATPTTEAYGIKILDTIDYNIDIPTNQQDMMNVDLAEAELSNLAGKVNRNINAVTIAAQLARNFNDVAKGAGAGGVAKNWVELAASNPNYLEAIITASAQLDNGNEAQGIDAYPDDFRAVIIRPLAKAALLKTGQLLIGGSNYAQDIIRKGGFDAGAEPSVATTGYMGDIAGMPVYAAAQAVWSTAAKYLGLEAKDLDGVQMLVVSGVSTGRALAFNSAIKMIDSPLGQGRRLQPKYRFGAECWDALSVVPVVANGFANPATAEAQLSVMAPGSRA